MGFIYPYGWRKSPLLLVEIVDKQGGMHFGEKLPAAQHGHGGGNSREERDFLQIWMVLQNHAEHLLINPLEVHEVLPQARRGGGGGDCQVSDLIERKGF